MINFTCFFNLIKIYVPFCAGEKAMWLGYIIIKVTTAFKIQHQYNLKRSNMKSCAHMHKHTTNTNSHSIKYQPDPL